MTAVTYTARRELIGGHVAESVYSMNLRALEGYPRRSRKVVADSAESLAGYVETLRHNARYRWEVQVLTTTLAERLQMREFLASTEGRETFTFDEFGSVASPGTTVLVRRPTLDFDEQPIGGSATSPIDEACYFKFDVEAAD